MKEYGNTATGDAMGVNAGCGNRAVAAHAKNLHAASKMSGSISSSIAPSKTLAHPPGAKSSVLKTPHATARPLD